MFVIFLKMFHCDGPSAHSFCFIFVIMVVMHVSEKVLISEKKTWLQVCSVVHLYNVKVLVVLLCYVLFCCMEHFVILKSEYKIPSRDP